MKYLNTYEAVEPNLKKNNYVDFTSKYYMNWEDDILVDILKKHGFDVKIEVDERTGHVIYYWLVFNSMPRVRLRAFNVGFLLNGLVPDMDLPPAIIIPVMNDIIDFYLPKNPNKINDILPYMSTELKHKYRAMIKGKQFDL